MITYKLTQAQYKDLASVASARVENVLGKLKPNLQEPIAYSVYDPLAKYEDLYWEDDLGDMDGKEITPLFDHPAPISKENMVKVLEALVGVDIALPAMLLEQSMNHAVRQYAKRQEAITIMQSAIEGMK